MARAATSFNKRDNEKKKLAKRLEKQKKKEERKNEPKGKGFEDMIAYVDENGMLTDTPPDMQEKENVNIEDIQIATPKKTEDAEPAFYKGRVEYFNHEKGYGFIKNLDNTDKYFFHISDCSTPVNENDIVFFELQKGKKGMNAVQIKTNENH